ncbi:MFS transporter [Sedimentibacter sp.]|uniref:MFS transporter n=1 Tax=Sedimentibacter sp. TaxID=1960295 RepID=UPI0028AE39E7|nr:MFS transporter [Sedimentibacter sp.]
MGNIVKNEKINMNLILLLAGRMVSDTGTSIQMVVMPLYIIDIGGSAATIGLYSFLLLVPALLVYPFAGVLGDRHNRKTIMVSTDFACGAAVLLLAFLAHSGSLTLPMLLLAQVAISVLNGLFDPATKGILPQLVEGDKLSRANSSVATLRTMSGMAGPVIGVLLYTAFGIQMLFLINGISFILSGLSETLIKYVYRKQQAETKFFADLLDGFRFILNQKMIRNLCFFLLAIYTMIMPLFSVALPLFFRTELNYSDAQYGFLQTITVAGALIGSVLVGVLFGKGKKEIKAIIVGLFLMMGMTLSFSMLLFPQSLNLLGRDTVLYYCVFAGVISLLYVSIMFINIPVQTVIQRETPVSHMSRVFAIVGMITRGGLPFGALIYGLLLEKIATHWAVLSTVILLLLISIMFQISLHRRPDKAS